ncbi:MAG: nuclear transport factor 2 family protein [Chloroflexota bacterium]
MVQHVTNEQVVRALWNAFDKAKFSEAKDLLSDDFVCVWQQSQERIVGADNFIAVNANYPGRWYIDVVKLVNAGDEIVTECRVYSDTTILRAVSFFTLENGKIKHLREFWPDPMEAQAWRRQWVEIVEQE